MTKAEKKRRRKKGEGERRQHLFIHPEFQLRVVAYLVAGAFALIVFFYLTNVYVFARFEAIGDQLGLDDSHLYFAAMAEQKRTVRAILFVSSFLILHLTFLGALILSHRVAGPLKRMQRHFDAIAEKRREPGPVSLREGDYFQELAESYNRQFEGQGEAAADVNKAGSEEPENR